MCVLQTLACCKAYPRIPVIYPPGIRIGIVVTTPLVINNHWSPCSAVVDQVRCLDCHCQDSSRVQAQERQQRIRLRLAHRRRHCRFKENARTPTGVCARRVVRELATLDVASAPRPRRTSCQLRGDPAHAQWVTATVSHVRATAVRKPTLGCRQSVASAPRRTQETEASCSWRPVKSK